MATGSMADWESIVSYGMLRIGHTPGQRSCMWVTIGMMDSLGDVVPITGAKGPFALGLSLSLH